MYRRDATDDKDEKMWTREEGGLPGLNIEREKSAGIEGRWTQGRKRKENWKGHSLREELIPRADIIIANIITSLHGVRREIYLDIKISTV